jgi:putative flippase GtrA
MPVATDKTGKRPGDAAATRLSLQIVRYGAVAAIAAAADTATLWLLVNLVGLHYTAAAALGFGIGLIVNFLLAREWVFAAVAAPRATEFGAYAIIGIVGVGLTELILVVAIDGAGLPLLMAKAIALVLVFLWNFFARRQLLYGRATA